MNSDSTEGEGGGVEFKFKPAPLSRNEVRRAAVNAIQVGKAGLKGKDISRPMENLRVSGEVGVVPNSVSQKLKEAINNIVNKNR